MTKKTIKSRSNEKMTNRELTHKPGWAHSFTIQQYTHFLKLVKNAITTQGLKVKIDEGIALVSYPEGRKVRMVLRNLAQECQKHEVADWSKIIEDYTNQILFRIPQTKRPVEKLTDEEIQSMLTVRLVPESYLDSVQDTNPPVRNHIPSLVTALALDFPEHVQTLLQPQSVQALGRSLDELFDIGMANIRDRNRYPVQIAPIKKSKAFEQVVDHLMLVAGDLVERLMVVTGNHYYVPTYALLFDEYPELVGRFGCLYGIPRRNVLMTYPIEDKEVINAAQKLLRLTEALFYSGPGALSPNMYWYYEKKHYFFHNQQDDKRLIFVPPPEFSQILNEMNELNKYK
ncbi:MAG: hypothetical protein ACFFC7_23805 [Candidatus Hermodarchaeota archaeon]